MDSQEELLSFLDLLDLDEELIDAPLRYLMGRSKYTMKHLKNAIMLLQYKALINSQEGTECDNEDEYDFVVKLLKDLNTTNIDYACKIINLVLCLNTEGIVSKAEHLLQQILGEIEFRSETPTSGFPDSDKERYTKMLLILKASDSIVNATIKNGEKLGMTFLETPLEKVLDTPDEQLKVYFLANTVPRFMEGVVGYNILSRIWMYLKYLKRTRKDDALKIFGCLSDYYLPSPEGKGDIKFVSQIIFKYDFWDIVLYGLTSDDASLRKISVYLAKKAIDNVIFSNTDLDVKLKNHTIFEWKISNAKALKSMWDNYFILIDSLEEKQGNIVLPSLKLFESIQIGDCWLNAAFNIGLKHDNTQVRLKCIEYKLKTEIESLGDAETLLGALNDINIYDQSHMNKILKEGMNNLLKNTQSFMNIFKAIPNIKWSPVPFYHLTDILANLNTNIPEENKAEIIKVITEILKVPCNSVVLRKAVHLNIANFITTSFENLDAKDAANIYDVIQLKTSSEINKENPFNSIVKLISLKKDDKIIYLKLWSEKNSYIDLIVMYLYNNEEDIALLYDIINEKVNKVAEGVSRQYADKTDNLRHVIYLIHMSSKTRDKVSNLHSINELISSQNEVLLQYILSLFSSDTIITAEDAMALFEKHNLQFGEKDLGDTLLQIYMTSLLFLNNNAELDKAVFSISAIKMLHKNPVMLTYFKHEMLDLKGFINLVSTLQFKDSQNESVGKLKNALYEQSCQIIYNLIEEDDGIESCKDEIINLIENLLEWGGYGCLKWLLKIMNRIINYIEINDEGAFNMTQFINRVWNEIEELKSNNQYSPCIEEFVELLTQDKLLQKSMYNNIIISYCNKIVENGPMKTNPLYYLIRKLKTKDFKDYGHLVYVLCEILLYCPVPRKDQRITDNLTLEMMEKNNFGIHKLCNDVHFNFEIQWLSLDALCSIGDLETLQIITSFITSRIDITFKNKQRYHGNSQMHRTLQTSLQHILMLVLKGVDVGNILNWCLHLLVKLPHQPSVRICLDWIISLHFYMQKTELGEEMIQNLKSNNVPLTSQFFIIYWILKHKITNGTYSEGEYNFVLDFLLSHTMGQLFNIRLNAQYLAITLYKLANKTTRHQYTIDIIEKTFAESSSDKTFTKLENDYFTNKFDIVANLSPYFIYYLLPKYCEVDNNEKVDVGFVKNVMKDINRSIDSIEVSTDFVNEWKGCDKTDETFADIDMIKRDSSNLIGDSEGSGTIQKKYVPWKNMGDVNLYDIEKKRESPSELIVVASLIDKLPNLGGMARTSEVFGVQTYVVDSLRHLQDKQFQGLSVSAERWINVEEVRPGRPLKDYLMRKKEEGYSVVAAEQTSTSCKLQSFKFPKKTILLLGHEKEGVPCDLLPIMDHCVEIPQQGFVRSLNVHVTAAIFVWEYARQNVL
ncbi:unnamed protein product [Chrysodeixis includens]|uniref:tRNA (guanosine(18)-2'-O)-methyltransferase TARBP1 n=1 Tax=Chrysodeixis includens TaxID=689277 RepID=A0A9P0BQB8_CHRIL|nr:unnamed protein product [Chrysodeixis includens]